MDFLFEPIQLPIRRDLGGALRVGSTRMVYELVIGAFQEGHDPRDVCEMFPGVDLGEISLLYGHYLLNRDKHDEMYRLYEEAGDRIRKRIEASGHGGLELKEKLRARLQEAEAARASVTQ